MKVVYKMFLLVGVALLLTLSSFGYFSYEREVEQYVVDMERDARLFGGALSAGVTEVWRVGGEDRAMALIAQTNQSGGLLKVRWVWASSPADDSRRPVVPLEELSILRQGITVSTQYRNESGRPMFFTYIPVTTPDGRLGAVEPAESLQPLSEFTQHGAHRIIVLICVLVAMGGVLIAIAGQHLVGAPVRDLVEQAARIGEAALDERQTTVLLVGESGTGKELAARTLHDRSRRGSAPFVPVNCAALPPALLESELFGHCRGAFTDARGEREGLLFKAEGGTLLLDEVGELPMELQPKLLRALEERRVRAVGSDVEQDVDVRIVAATNRDLESTVAAGQFREDLYYRLNVIQVELPPLRARGTDILLLAQHFLEHFARRQGRDVTGIARSAAQKLLAYRWPGNVRELRNAMERAIALTRHDRLGADDLPDRVRAYRASRVVIGGDDPSELVSLEELESRYTLHVLEMFGGNRTRAARLLGLDRKTLYRKLQHYSDDGVSLPHSKDEEGNADH